jgi:hypothetical protein
MRKKILSLMLAGIITISTYIPAHANTVSAIQEQEPNNSIAQAQEIRFNDKISGLKDNGEDDYFKFIVPKGSIVTLDMTIYNSDLALIDLYDSSEEEIDWCLPENGENQYDIELDSGTYYIQVTDLDDYSSTKFNYDLVLYKSYFYDCSGHWAENQINEFVDLGYVGGYEDKTFKPNNSITRAEFVRILNNTFGLTKSSGKVFNDTQYHWAKTDIDIAVTNGVCNGKSATEFKPNDPITREEAAVMISNYKKLSDTNYDKLNIYTDRNEVSTWAKDGVEGVIENGYMNGYSDNTFKPKNKITRAEAVVTLGRVK